MILRWSDQKYRWFAYQKECVPDESKCIMDYMDLYDCTEYGNVYSVVYNGAIGKIASTLWENGYDLLLKKDTYYG